VQVLNQQDDISNLIESYLMDHHAVGTKLEFLKVRLAEPFLSLSSLPRLSSRTFTVLKVRFAEPYSRQALRQGPLSAPGTSPFSAPLQPPLGLTPLTLPSLPPFHFPQAQIQSSEELVNFRLDMYRNDLLFVEMTLIIFMLALAVGSFVTGCFGASFFVPPLCCPISGAVPIAHSPFPHPHSSTTSQG
jgi:hypothetical protein